jgi:uncharacterized membrane protein YjdF
MGHVPQNSLRIICKCLFSPLYLPDILVLSSLLYSLHRYSYWRFDYFLPVILILTPPLGSMYTHDKLGTIA